MTRLTLLGTGSADGWPNPFCRCASCETLRARGEVRGHTSLLVDDALLVDLGPDVPRAAERLGVGLDRLRVVVLTHDHPDHVAPLALLARHWAGRREPLDVVGPAAAVTRCRDWVAPTEDVAFHALDSGDGVVLAGYRIEALAARHEGPEVGPALLYRLTAPDGARLLHATDTGPLPEQTHRALAGTRVDVALLDLTFGDHLDHGTDHLDLRSFPQVLARLRSDGVVGSATEVVAVHLSHHNPPDLGAVVADWGVRVLPDGARWDVGGARAERVPRRARRTVVLGGARSGKSAHAERLLAVEPVVTYVATGGRRPGDPEWEARVAAHRERRPADWRTVETTDIEAVLAAATADDVVLVDCLTLWLTSVLDDAEAWDDPPQAAKVAQDRCEGLLDAWRSTAARVVAVSNEVGSGVVPPTPSGRLFRDLHGRLNATLARHSEQVHLVVAGRVLDLSPAAQEQP